MISCNVLLPQLHWLPKFRTTLVQPRWSAAIGWSVNVGMWFERFVIICTRSAAISALELGLLRSRRRST